MDWKDDFLYSSREGYLRTGPRSVLLLASELLLVHGIHCDIDMQAKVGFTIARVLVHPVSGYRE